VSIHFTWAGGVASAPSSWRNIHYTIGSYSMARTSAPASEGEQDAIALLKSDHRQVKALFSEFDKLKDDGPEEDRAAIVAQSFTVARVSRVR
jgi:hypothetical protein